MFSINRSIPLTLAFAISGVASAHAAPISVKSFVKDAAGVTFQMNPGVLRLQVCSARIVRVIYTPEAQLPNTKSFVTIKEWKPVDFKIKQDAKTITLSTANVRVLLNRATGALSFLDAAGRPLLQEAADGGKSLSPTRVGEEQTHTVQQVFQSPADEAIYGLGQFQDGLWNWRGIPLELRQVNTQVAIPMMVSSKGYGLMWDNASLLDFNPADQRITLDGSSVPATPEAQPLATEDLAKAPINMSDLGKMAGSFTTTEAGDYVFQAKDGNRRGDFAIIVNGREVAGVTNTWTPYSLSAKVKLPAHTTVAVGLRGGGQNAKLFVRPLGDTTTFRSQMGEAIDYTFFAGPKLDDVIAGYREATGAAPMWPKWAYGFWQCRERYSSQGQIQDTVAEFRRRQIPMDLIVQDWQYWGPHGWGSYQWDERQYPDPPALLKNLHDQNAKFMISTWHNPHGTALEKLQKVNGMIGEWIDVYNPEARRVRWETLNEAFFSIGMDAWWNDATEPGDPGEGLTGQKTAMGNGDRLRNSYPLFAAQDVYDGQRSAGSAKRVVNLTRSAYLGMQRYSAAAWSGDINGNWETFKRQIPAGLNVALTGLPYWTTDTGGFFRPNGQYTSADYNELLTRWFQWSTFCPILRIHGYQSETEMWKYLPETQKNLLAFDQLRYRMLPYNYSVAWKVTDSGYSIMRPLQMDFPNDQKTLNIADEYLFGPAFLVAPVTTPLKSNSGTRKVYLPAGTDWFNFWTGEKLRGGQEISAAAPLDQMPLFVRAGSVVPMGPVVQYAGENKDAPLEVRVYPGADGSFDLYDDEGDSYDYEKGERSVTSLRWTERNQQLTIGKPQGHYPNQPNQRQFHVVVVRPGIGTGIQETPTAQADARLTQNGDSVNFRRASSGS